MSSAFSRISGDALSARVSAGLIALITEQQPGARDIHLHDLVRSAGGLSRENWAFTARWHDTAGAHEAPLMLMRDAVGTLLNSERGREFGVLKALATTPVPTPAAFWVDADGHYLDAPSIVMERVTGQCDYMALNSQRPLAERLGLAKEFLALLVQIQAVAWQPLGLDKTLGLPEGSPAGAELAHWEAEFRRVQLEPQPELDYVLAWLQARAPTAETLVLVHGDFKPGNALIDGTRISAKLDWETAHLGDPLEDLGWITNPVRRREHQIEGHWERAEMIAAYEAATGRVVNRADLVWWNIFSCWKLAIIQLTAVNEFVAGRYDRVFQTPTWLFRPMFQMMRQRP